MAAPSENTVISRKVERLLKHMTLAEKVGQMTQIDFAVIAEGGRQNRNDPIDPAKLEDAVLNHHVGSIFNTPFTPKSRALPVNVWRRLTETIRAAAARSRLKIPVLYGVDAIHGATYTEGATLFPQAINMAATFNPALSFREGEITAREMRASGLGWNFSPVMDIGRQPLWPRLWETYGEDVHLAATLGAQFIQGQQGRDFSAADKVMTCLKHFVGYSFPFSGKDRTPAHIGERQLRDYFLPTFKAGIEAGAPTVMINSGEVDGLPGHANRRYLTDILRKELGFTGFTVSDWEDIKRLYTRDKLAASEAEAVKIAVMAGVDMSMVPMDYSFPALLMDLVRNGEVPIARVNEAVRRILTVKFRAGLFDNPAEPIPAAEHFATPEAAALNRQAARESIILAKNDRRVLPLPKDSRILVTGPAANLLSVLNGGWTITWQGDDERLYPKDKLTLVQALRQQSTGKVTHIGGDRFEQPIDPAKVAAAAREHDVIVLCLGEKPYTETLGNISDLALAADQRILAEAALATGKPVVVVMLGGRPRIITAIAEKAAAVVLGFLPGMEGGVALADILYGDYNPDGKLPITYPRAVNDLVPYDYKPAESFEQNRYHPLYPFGHGLSYTTFATGGLKVHPETATFKDRIKIEVDVKNTGARSGKETVLVYLNDNAASVTRPNRQLKAFAKVALAPGESRHLDFTLTPDDLSFTGVDYRRRTEAGGFTVTVGGEQAHFTLRR